jgi:tRNA-splicing ligase RtcB
MDRGVSEAIDRLRRAPSVLRIAVMPDVHLAADVCVGTVVGTSDLIYPQAVGGDIGCGMLAVALDITADRLGDPRIAAEILGRIGAAVPAARRNRRSTVAQPEDLLSTELSDPSLERIRRREGALELGTLGSGNHFLEIQADEEERLWLVVHSGSRAMGPAIRDHHLARAEAVGSGLRALDAGSDAGKAYLHDAAWARRYADASRTAMIERAAETIASVLGVRACPETTISTDHNHVAIEEHDGRRLWVHRKGAMSAPVGAMGVLPGSMGTATFHVEGRGCPESLLSSAHGAGRAMSREAARKAIGRDDLLREMRGIWYDHRMAESLRDEAPSAYKDIRAVLRAQRELVKVVRVLRPVLNYKGR